MMYLIFSFSSQTGEVSGELSYKISYNIVETKSEILHEGKSYDELNYEANSIQFYVRKAAPLYVYRVRGFWLFLLAGIFCAGFAGLDEYHQSFVSGRSPSVRDVCIDSSGALIGIILVQLFCWSTLHNPSGSHKKKKKTRSAGGTRNELVPHLSIFHRRN